MKVTQQIAGRDCDQKGQQDGERDGRWLNPKTIAKVVENGGMDLGTECPAFAAAGVAGGKCIRIAGRDIRLGILTETYEHQLALERVVRKVGPPVAGLIVRESRIGQARSKILDKSILRLFRRLLQQRLEGDLGEGVRLRRYPPCTPVL